MTYLDTLGNLWTSGPPGAGLLGYSPPNAPLTSPAFTGNPTAPTQAALNNSTRLADTAYVDAAVTAGIATTAASTNKQSVQESTAAALPANAYVAGVLTASANGVLTVDGIAVALADRILVQNEVTGSNNGIYTVTTLGTAGVKYVLTRATDFNTSAQILGATVNVTHGPANGGFEYMVSGIGPFTMYSN